jgi:trehalose utilization protein
MPQLMTLHSGAYARLVRHQMTRSATATLRQAANRSRLGSGTDLAGAGAASLE